MTALPAPLELGDPTLHLGAFDPGDGQSLNFGSLRHLEQVTAVGLAQDGDLQLKF